MDKQNPITLNEKELMEYYNLRGSGGKISLKLKCEIQKGTSNFFF